MSRMKAEDIKVFSDAARAFFTQTTNITATVRTAYLFDGDETVRWNEFQSCIDIGGQYQGVVAFCAPRAMLTSVLLRVGERDYSDANHHDITGEIANQMSGYVRRYFGEGMHISPPISIQNNMTFLNALDHNHSFIIPITWDAFEAKLFVNIKKIS